jgi:hypothetical protein
MRRHIPGLHLSNPTEQRHFDGLFLVRVDKAAYRWHSQKPFLELRLVVVEPTAAAGQTFSGRLYCTPRALWKLDWFLRDFGYDMELLGRDQIDEKSLVGLHGVVRTTHTIVNGRSYQNLEAFAPASEWESISSVSVSTGKAANDDL